MRLLWERLARAFAARQKRERLWIAALLVLGLPAALLFGWVEPQWRTQAALKREQAELKAQLTSLQVLAAQAADPNAIAQAELKALRERSSALRESLAELSRLLVAPSEMSGVLEGLLARHPGIRLIALRTAGSEPLRTDGSDEMHALFRHGIELELAGRWADLQAYVLAAERMPKQLVWDRIEVQVERYPVINMKLTVRTLSTDAAWMQL